MPWNLDKTLVKGKIVPYGILPALFVVLVVRKVLEKESILNC